MVLRMDCFGLAGQAEDEVGVNRQTERMAVAREVSRPLDGRALLDVLENLRIARLEAHDQQPAAGFAHGLQRVVIRGHARGAAPGDAQRLQLLAKLDGAHLLDVEGVVVEEEFLHFGEVLFGPLHLRGHIVRRPLAPGVTARAFAATGRRCTAPGSRAWNRARCRDAAGTARCSVSRPCRACRFSSPMAWHQGLRSAGGRGCERPCRPSCS